MYVRNIKERFLMLNNILVVINEIYDILICKCYFKYKEMG